VPRSDVAQEVADDGRGRDVGDVEGGNVADEACDRGNRGDVPDNIDRQIGGDVRDVERGHGVDDVGHDGVRRNVAENVNRQVCDDVRDVERRNVGNGREVRQVEPGDVVQDVAVQEVADHGGADARHVHDVADGGEVGDVGQ